MNVSDQRDTKTNLARLQSAANSMLNFNAGRISELRITPAQARSMVEEELSHGTVIVDGSGLTGGMRSRLLGPVREIADQWEGLRNNFNIAIQPAMADLTDVDEVEGKIAALIVDGKNRQEAIKAESRKDTVFRDKEATYQQAKIRYDSFVSRHGNRKAVMFAKSPFYWCVLALVLLTECFVNYHSFNAFWGVPAVALGTTIILGVLLALAAHGHGEILKQWSVRFGQARDIGRRRSDWRMLAMSTGALAIVLAFTGWARWAAAVDNIVSQAQDSILGPVGVVQVNPSRDVFISLIANIGAWMVGVIISYFAHDVDDEYMETTGQYNKALKVWNRAEKPYVDRLKQVEAATDKEIVALKQSAETRRASVKAEFDCRAQVDTAQESFMKKLNAALNDNLDTYRAQLVGVVNNSAGRIKLEGVGGVPLQLADLQRKTYDANSLLNG